MASRPASERTTKERAPTALDAANVARILAGIDRLTFGAGRAEGAARALPPVSPSLARILVAVDGTPASLHAVEWARTLVPLFGASVRLVTVVAPGFVPDFVGGAIPSASSAVLEAEERAARDDLARLAERLASASIPSESAVLVGPPISEIVSDAERWNADLVILGAHGVSTTERLLLGSVAEGVRNRAATNVLIAKGPPPPENLLLPVDGSRASARAALLGLTLAHAFDARATIHHAVRPPIVEPTAAHHRFIEATRDLHIEWGLDWVGHILEFEKPVESIVLATARERSDLIVMGSHGLGGVRSLVSGSVSYRVAHEAPCSILIVKDKSERE